MAQEWNWCGWMMPRLRPSAHSAQSRGVDDTASLLVRWDNGSGLNVVYGEDIVRKVAAVKTVCYEKTLMMGTLR